MTKQARLEGVAKEHRRRSGKRATSTIVFWRDYENEYLYTKPFEEEGSQLVTPEEFELAQHTYQNVIIVGWKKTPLPSDNVSHQLKDAMQGTP